MPIGTCPMCLSEDKQIGSSHLMPAGLYETCRNETSEPIKVSDEIVMETSRQTQDYLLCVGKGSCEEILNKEGEQWTLPMLMKKDRSFPLYDLLKSKNEFDEAEGKAFFAARIPEIDVKKLTHFAMGIFWKASVHSWKKEKGKSRINLGRYSEAIRQYLIGEAGFPERLALLVNLVEPEKAMILFTDPVTGNDRHSHFFYVPGLLFSLMVDRSALNYETQVACFATNIHHPIVVFDGLTELFDFHLRRQYFSAPKSRKYLEAKKARDAQTVGGLSSNV
jgi:hypothetical protein